MSRAWILPCGHARVRIRGALDFDSVGWLLAQSHWAFAGEKRLVVDLQGVGRANSAGLVLLLEWLAMAHRRGVSLRFDNLPQSLTKLAAVSNVAALLPTVPSSD